MCFLQFVGHRVLCHMPEASEGREAVVESILVCGKGQEKQLRLTLCTPRICHSGGLIRASLNHVWAIGESLLGFLNPTWDSVLEGRGGGDPKWPTKGCTYPLKGIAGERFLQWNSNSYNGFKESTKCPDTETKCNPSWSADRDFSWAWPLPSFPTPIFQRLEPAAFKSGSEGWRGRGQPNMVPVLKVASYLELPWTQRGDKM